MVKNFLFSRRPDRLWGFESKSTPKLSFDRSVLVSGHRTQIFFILEIFLIQLRVCYFVAPSLTIERFRNLLLLLSLANAVPLGSQFYGTQDHILLTLPTWRARSRIHILQGEGGPVIPPGTGFPFRPFSRLAGLQ
jgi:hypothetical protein